MNECIKMSMKSIKAFDLSACHIAEIDNNHGDEQSATTLEMLYIQLNSHIDSLAEQFNLWEFDIENDDIGAHHNMVESAYYVLNSTHNMTYGYIDTLIDSATNFVRIWVA